MKYCFTLNLTDSPSIMERILRTVRHRGFNLTAMNLTTDRGTMDLNICVESDLPAHLIYNQLAKLHDVVHISSWEPERMQLQTADVTTTRQ